jgi:cell division protein FtsL
MHIPKSIRFSLTFIFTVVLTATFVVIANQGQRNLPSNERKDVSNKQAADNYYGPIVDYNQEEEKTSLINSKEHTLRYIRSNRYQHEAPEPLGELPPNWEGFSIHSHWQMDLTSFPIIKSDAVIVGQVLDAQAYLSNDKTAVYSEFTIGVEEVLKISPAITLTSNSSLVAERKGGVVRFNDDRLLPFTVDDQGMPHIGRKYLFFLVRNKQGDDYHILTGYELRHTKVLPLDTGDQFATYSGYDKTAFLDKVRTEIASASK